MTTDWLPASLPDHVSVNGLVLVPLAPALVADDYAAVTRDIRTLRQWGGDSWPTEDFSIEENLVDVARHDREQRERVALTYSVLIDDVVQGCVYVLPLVDSLLTRGVDAPVATLATADIVVRGWLHDRPATVLIAACLTWLSAEPFTFPRLWWQANSDCTEQLAACDALGLVEELAVEAADRTWVLRSVPR